VASIERDRSSTITRAACCLKIGRGSLSQTGPANAMMAIIPATAVSIQKR